MSQEPPKKRTKRDDGDEDYRPDTSERDAVEREIIDLDELEDGGRTLHVDTDVAQSRYDANKDGPPEHPAYHRLFSEAHDAMTFIRNRAMTTLTGRSSKHLSRLYERLDAVARVPRPDIVRIALVGQPGSGKSSLINSILDCPGLAVTGSSGSSCTNVAVEFTAPLPNQAALLAAEVNFHDEGLRDFVLQVVEDYRRPLADSEDMDADDDEDESGKSGNHEKDNLQAENAFSMLSGLLRVHTKFSDEGQLRAYLDFNEVGEDGQSNLNHVVDELHCYLNELINTVCFQSRSKMRFLQANTAKDLNWFLQPFTRVFATKGEPQLWPLVKRVRIGLQKCSLLDHVIIADLPGLDDDNRLRCQATHEYLHKCDAAWVIAQINRVCDSTHVSTTIRNLTKRMDGRVALVCTHSDVGANADLFNDLKMRFPCDDLTALNAAREELQQTKKMAGRTERILLIEKDRETKKDLRDIWNQQKREIQAANYSNFLSLVQLRVKYVQADMKRRFPTLRVFGASNDLYTRLRFDNPNKNFHQLQVDHTGIRELRHHSLKIPGDRSWKTTQNYYRGPLKDFRDLLAIVVQSRGIQGRHEWQDKLEIPFAAIKRNTTDYFESGVGLFEDLITNHIVAFVDRHRLRAQEASKKWEEEPFTHSIYNKFARNKGSFGHRKVPQQNWNEQLAGSIKRDLKIRWTDLLNKQEDKQKAFLTTLSARLQNSIPGENTESEDDKPLFVQQFEDMTTRQSDTLKSAIADDFGKLRDLVGSVQWRMEGTGPDSYIAKELTYTYKSIAQESGPGMKKRMHAIMKGRLEDRNRDIILILAHVASKEFKERREPHREIFDSEISSIISKIEDNYKAMSEDFPADEELNEVRKSLNELFDKTVKPKMEKIERALKELQRQYFVDAH